MQKTNAAKSKARVVAEVAANVEGESGLGIVTDRRVKLKKLLTFTVVCHEFNSFSHFLYSECTRVNYDILCFMRVRVRVDYCLFAFNELK